MQAKCFGAAGEVTGSCLLLDTGRHRLLLDCGLFQGSRSDEERNREDFPFPLDSIDAVILSHAHLDHSGRIPLLIKAGYTGPVYAHAATRDLCRIMLKDSGYLNEKDAQWENRKRQRKGLRPVEPIYTLEEAKQSMRAFRTLPYDERRRILPGVHLRLRDAGHILGSAIVELELETNGTRRRLVFTGDLGHRGAPILRDPARVEAADLVIMESTYGDRSHRSWDATWTEMAEVLDSAANSGGNVMVPAFAVGRTQELLYAMQMNYRDWGMDRWQIFLDSPMAIEATRVYSRHVDLYDAEARAGHARHDGLFDLPNLRMTRTANQSMAINRIRSGAIIIAGSGMCTGGRIKHHFKHNLWRSDSHVLMVGFQARGTLGRRLVDGAQHVRLWGETIRVGAQIHTIGGLSAHADQAGLLEWYEAIAGRPPVILVHGEEEPRECLAGVLRERGAKVRLPQRGETLDL